MLKCGWMADGSMHLPTGHCKKEQNDRYPVTPPPHPRLTLAAQPRVALSSSWKSAQAATERLYKEKVLHTVSGQSAQTKPPHPGHIATGLELIQLVDAQANLCQLPRQSTMAASIRRP